MSNHTSNSGQAKKTDATSHTRLVSFIDAGFKIAPMQSMLLYPGNPETALK